MTKEGRNPKREKHGSHGPHHSSSFRFLASFDIRISSFPGLVTNARTARQPETDVLLARCSHFAAGLPAGRARLVFAPKRSPAAGKRSSDPRPTIGGRACRCGVE